jgi:hypothetical protein
MSDIPDINISYLEGGFDKDVGYCASQITIRQSGTRLTIQTICTENEIETQRYDEAGTITRVYEKEGLVQVTLDDGRRTYVDLNAKKLRSNAEFINGWLEIESFDVQDNNRIAGLIQWMNHIAREIEPAFEIGFPEQSDIAWGEYDYPLAAYGSLQRKRVAVIGSQRPFSCQLTMTEDPDVDSHYQFARLLLEARGLPAGADVSFIVNSYGHSTISVRSPPEKHPAVLDAIKTHIHGIRIVS